MKVLVLGGNGFIGKKLAENLRIKNYQVISFDLEKPNKQKKDVQYVTGNFFEDDDILSYIKNVDIVYHAISSINPGNSNKKYLQGYMYDFLQSVKLCEWSATYGFKIIFLSSGGTVYGYQTTMPIRESNPTMPINHYGNIKLCIENTLQVFNKQQGTHNLIARISNPYGPGQDYLKGVGFIDAVLKHTINHETIEIWGDGLITRDYIYIDDVCNMLETLISYSGVDCIFNISSNTGTTQNQIVNFVREIVPDVSIKYLPKRSVDVPQIILDNTRIRKLYPFKCLPIQKGIERYYEYLRQSASV